MYKKKATQKDDLYSSSIPPSVPLFMSRDRGELTFLYQARAATRYAQTG